MQTMWQDLRYAARMLAKKLALTGMVLGIAAALLLTRLLEGMV